MKILKRLFDLVFAMTGLIILLPVLAVVAAVVKLHDGGPVFFVHERVGRNFRKFGLLKFRTMRHGGDGAALPGPEVTAGTDPRITRPGRLLRKSKIDELPQLVNVLKGDMSIVGPRPEVAAYVDLFRREYEEILKVRPGITDPASIFFADEETVLAGAADPERYYRDVVLPAKLGLNARYVKHMSLTRDIGIIIRTLTRVYFPVKRHSDVCCPIPGAAPGSNGRAAAGAKGKTDDGAGRLRARLVGLARKRRAVLVGLFHLLVVVVANVSAFVIRFDGDIPANYLAAIPYSILLAVAVRMPLFYAFGIHRGVWRYAGVDDLRKIVLAATAGSVIMHAVYWQWGLTPDRYPHSVVLLDWMLLIAMSGGVRLGIRVMHEYRLDNFRDGRKTTLVIGAGEAGEQIVREMKTTSTSHFPIGFVDDDPAKKGLCIHGVPILGAVADLPAVIGDYAPEEILIAIPSARPAMLRALMTELSGYSLPVKTLPKMTDIVDGNVSVSQIRPIELEDLLGRPMVKTDTGRLESFIRGKRVMVTGAGGSIGSEICRQAACLGAATVIAFERHENSLYRLDQEFTGHRPGRFYPVVGDVNDERRLEEVFETYMPDILFHAAAHKHVPMMELNPREAVYNNVLGTKRTAELAGRYGVGTFVLISTDKAVNPTSVMGASKRACELIVRAMHKTYGTSYITVRFGNVMGSSGSVVPLFKEQIIKGGPVTVTHPDVERFLMMIPEAVQLVLEAATIGKGGELFVLNMGTPIKIEDLAKNLIMLSGFEPGTDIDIEYVGLRPGEKLCEELFCKSEEVVLTPLSKVFMAVSWDLPDRDAVMRYSLEMERCLAKRDTPGMLDTLSRMVGSYTPQVMDSRPASAA